MDEFEELAFVARPPMSASVAANANARKRLAMARVVSRVFRAANDALRADMLTHLLRPLGPLGLVAVASGAFARLGRHDGMVPDTISAEDVVRYSSEQVRELALFAYEVNPDAFQPLVEQLAQPAMGIVALSTAALVLLYRSSQRRPAVARSSVPPPCPCPAGPTGKGL
jgi:hypothetical protein